MTLCDILTTDRMDAGRRQMLQMHRETIVTDLDATDIIDELYSQKVLSSEDTEKIRSHPERSYQTRCLLDILERKNSPETYTKFVKALQSDYSWLSNKLQNHDQINGIDNTDRQNMNNEQIYQDALALGNVPRLPNLHVEREKEIERVQYALRQMSRGECVALCGMTGSGKTVLATAAIRNKELLENHFDMHVFWLNAGEAQSPEEAANLMHRLGRMVNPSFTRESHELMKVGLSHYLRKPEYSNALIVLDDVLSHEVIDLFDLGCKMLLTTQVVVLVQNRRNAKVLDVSSGFSETETLKLFSSCTGVPSEKLPNEARHIHGLCKGAPLTITLLASMMEPHKHEASDVERWRYYINMIKDKKDGTWIEKFFRRRNKEKKKDYLTNTIKHCLERLSPETREQYKHFVLFPEDVNITCKTLEVILQKSKYEVEDILTELRNKSLIGSAYNHDLQCYVYGIHALLLGYLKAVVEPAELRRMHKELVRRYLKASEESYAKLPNDNYIYTYIGYHLREAGLKSEFPSVYFDLHFLAAKARSAGVADLLLDLRRYKNCITSENRPELIHRLEAVERFVHDNGQLICDKPVLDVVQLALQSRDFEMRQLAESAAVTLPHRLFLRERTTGDARGMLDGMGIVCDEAPNTPALELGENVRAACFAHHANYVLVGDKDGRVRMWNHDYRRSEREYHGHRDAAVDQLEVSVGETRFFSRATDGYVKVWTIVETPTPRDNGTSSDELVPSPSVRQKNWMDLSGGKFEERPSDTSQLFHLIDDKIIAAGFSKCNDSLLICGSQQGKVVVWNITSNDQIFYYDSKESIFNNQQTKPVTACCLAGNDHLVIFAIENFIYIYDLRTSAYLSHLNNEVDVCQLLIPDHQVDEDKLIVRSRTTFNLISWKERRTEDGNTALEKLNRQDIGPLDTPNEEYTCAAVTWDGQYLIAGTSSGSLLIWPLLGPKIDARVMAPPGTASAICLDTYVDEESNSNVVFLLLSGDGDGRIRRWHVSPIQVDQPNNVNEAVQDKVRLTGTFAARWLDNSIPLVAATTEDNHIRVYIGCSLVAEIPSRPQKVTQVAIQVATTERSSEERNKEERYIAIGYDDGLVSRIDYHTKIQRPIMQLTNSVSYLEYISCTYNNGILVAATEDGCYMITTKDQRSIRLQRGGSGVGLVMSIWINTYLLTVAKDGCVKSWEPNEGELVDVLVPASTGGPGNLVTTACVSVRRDRLCVARNDGRVRYYKLENSELSAINCIYQDERQLEGPLLSSAWSSDSRYLAVGNSTGRIDVLQVGSGGGLDEFARINEHSGPVNWLGWSPPPGGGAPNVLVSAGDRLLIWWDVCRLGEQIQTSLGVRRRSAARRSRPEPLDLSTLGPALPQLMSDPAWCGKRGAPDRQELLAAIPLADSTHHLCSSSDFMRFVTVDNAGVLHVLSILRPGDSTPSPPSDNNLSPT